MYKRGQSLSDFFPLPVGKYQQNIFFLLFILLTNPYRCIIATWTWLVQNTTAHCYLKKPFPFVKQNFQTSPLQPKVLPNCGHLVQRRQHQFIQIIYQHYRIGLPPQSILQMIPILSAVPGSFGAHWRRHQKNPKRRKNILLFLCLNCVWNTLFTLWNYIVWKAPLAWATKNIDRVLQYIHIFEGEIEGGKPPREHLPLLSFVRLLAWSYDYSISTSTHAT